MIRVQKGKVLKQEEKKENVNKLILHKKLNKKGGMNMPRGDKTGPAGAGAMTGRSMGYCAGYNSPGYLNQGCGRGCGRGFGRGFGAGRGMGQGFGRRFWTTPQEIIQATKEPTQKELLSELTDEREEIDKAIKELKQKKK